MDTLTLYIAIMAIITFSFRYCFFAKNIKIKLNKQTESILSFTAPSVLTAMWVPIVFGDLITQQSIANNPFLIAGICTIIASLFIKNTLIVVIFSMAVFSLLKAFL